MKTKTKIIVTVVAVCLAVFGAYKFVDTYSHSYAENKAINYLCRKYDEDASAFEVLDYQQARHTIHETSNFIGDLVWIDFTFEIKYNEKTFFVKKYKGKYYDDYQLDDIERWCTDWLKNNISSDILGIKISSNDLISFMISNNKNNYCLIDKSDVEKILYSSVHNKVCDSTTEFYVMNNDNAPAEAKALIRENLCNKFSLERVCVDYTTNTNVQLNIYKPKSFYNHDYEWVRYYYIQDDYV